MYFNEIPLSHAQKQQSTLNLDEGIDIMNEDIIRDSEELDVYSDTYRTLRQSQDNIEQDRGDEEH